MAQGKPGASFGKLGEIATDLERRRRQSRFAHVRPAEQARSLQQALDVRHPLTQPGHDPVQHSDAVGQRANAVSQTVDAIGQCVEALLHADLDRQLQAAQRNTDSQSPDQLRAHDTILAQRHCRAPAAQARRKIESLSVPVLSANPSVSIPSDRRTLRYMLDILVSPSRQ